MIDKLKSLRYHDGFMKYFKNTSWLFGEKILRMITALFIGVWVTRYLGPEKFGLLSYAQSFVALFSPFAALGLDGIVSRELIKRESNSDIILGTSFWLKLFGAIISILIIYSSLKITSNYNETKSLVFIIASANLFQSFNIIEFYFQSKVLGKNIAFSHITSLVFGSLLKILLILNNSSLKAFAWVIFFESILLSGAYLYQFKKIKRGNFKFPKFKNIIALSLLKDSLPLIIGSFSATIYMKIDQLMIKEFMNSESLGIYAVSSRISDIPIFITVVITSSLFPSIIKAHEYDDKLFMIRLQNMYNFLVKIAVGISIVICIFSSNIVEILYGNPFIKSGKILSIYIWSIIFIFMSNISTNYFLAKNLVFHASMRLVLGAILNIILNLVLIKKYGLEGAVISTLISYAISSYFYNLFFKNTFENFKLQTKSIINLFNLTSYKTFIKIK